MMRVRDGTMRDEIIGSCSWYSKYGVFQPSAGVGSKHLSELLARHGQEAQGVGDPDKWRGLLEDFSQWGALDVERYYHGRGEFGFRAGADAEQVAEHFWAFYLRVVEPRLQSVRTPGDLLRLSEREIGPHGMHDVNCAAAAWLSGDEGRARAFLRMSMAGYALAEERGYRGIDPSSTWWPIAASMLRELGGDPQKLPTGPEADWPMKDPRFIARRREGRRLAIEKGRTLSPGWIGYT